MDQHFESPSPQFEVTISTPCYVKLSTQFKKSLFLLTNLLIQLYNQRHQRTMFPLSYKGAGAVIPLLCHPTHVVYREAILYLFERLKLP